METAKISQLYDLGETIAAELFAGLTYPWEALPKISGFIKKLGPTLDPEFYQGECHRRKRLRGGQFNRIEKRCDF